MSNSTVNLALDNPSTFQSHLQRWGPDATDRCESAEQAARYCRHLATGHYENFPVASWILPRDLRQPMCNVYAFCRWADDLGDEVASPEESLRLLDWWRDNLRRCYDNDRTHPVFIALGRTIDDYNLPREPFADLIDAFVQDQTVTHYETFADLTDYCRRSANPVGRLVLKLFGQETPQRIHWSDNVCTGLQLINFWQDVARDADIGRTYLPAEDCERFGYSEEMLRQRESNHSFRQLVEFEVERARSLLMDGQKLCAELSGRRRLVIDMFWRGGVAVCDKVATIGYDTWQTRPTLSKLDAAKLAPNALAAAIWSRVFGVRTSATGSST